MNKRDQDKQEDWRELGKYADMQGRPYCPLCRLVTAPRPDGRTRDKEMVQIRWLPPRGGFQTNICEAGTSIYYFSREDGKSSTTAGKLVPTTEIDVSSFELF
jgi:hypothetical protein